ncbi:MAG: imidazole glycerol phosphate synthase subunit HisH [Gammaproteobacteria bacterium]|nr:imidazole glycerol phosphate synthase subunit HisH [Gammaproteobacteria bacterium]
MKPRVAIVDSGGANIASLQHAFGRIGVAAELSADPESIRAATHVVLPGVGAAADAMQRLAERNLSDAVRTLKQPVLGICLGMQLLADASDEDSATCLGVLPGRSTALPASPESPVPHMGWSRIAINRPDALLAGIDDGCYFYFLHSFALAPSAHSLATACHGVEFSAVLQHRNFRAVQFHPERSSRAGARLLSNFVGL